MKVNLRQRFNEQFSDDKYQEYLQKVEALAPGTLDFRVAETPVFVPKDFTDKMLEACDHIVDVIIADNFKTITERSIPNDLKVPGENDHPQCLVFDFGVCENEKGTLVPQLIEMQGFPTLFAFQAHHSALTAAYADLPENYSAYLNGFDEEKYIALLREILLENHKPENVILLEIFPEKQKTRIDFYCTEKMFGIRPVCYTDLIADGDHLYYRNGKGEKTIIHRIYNRLIFDDLHAQENLKHPVDLTKKYEVEWVPHPNWFYRISKFTLPFIHHPYVPETFFLNEVTHPLPLEEYVLKPLFSFAGMGVVIDVTQADVDAIKDPENWILQKKVNYAAVVPTPDEPAKAEIRLFFFWKPGDKKPVAVHNLARLSKGKMIGTRYNKDKKWVGGSVAFFEK